MAGTQCTYLLRDGQAELNCVAGLTQDKFMGSTGGLYLGVNPDSVTMPSTNQGPDF